MKQGLQWGSKRAVLVGGIQYEDCEGGILIIMEPRTEYLWSSLYFIRAAEEKAGLSWMQNMRVKYRCSTARSTIAKITIITGLEVGTGRKV